MEIVNIKPDRITVAMSPEEVAVLSNTINEALEAVEVWEFQIRTGVTRERAIEIQTQLRELLASATRQ
jgi:hypothetical protein